MNFQSFPLRRFAALLALSLCSPLHGAGSGEFGLNWILSSYYGLDSANLRTMAVDPRGNIYVSGGTKEADWPVTKGAPHQGHQDVIVAKFSPELKLLWSRFLGGPDEDFAHVSAVNERGELYLAGRAGRGFPTTEGAFDRSFNGGTGGGPHLPSDAFVTKLSPDGDIIYSTYIGGSGDDIGRAIHLLEDGRLLVGGGNTRSPDLPTDRGTLPGPVLKPHLGGGKDSWVGLLAADGGSLEFCTYFGPDDDSDPRGDETIRGLGLDRDGNIWIGGTTSGHDMQPTADAFGKTRGDMTEAYVAKLSIDGRKLLYFSWLGGNGPDEIETESVSDADGNFYVAGSTGSMDFPATPGAFQTTLKGGRSFAAVTDLKAWLAGKPAPPRFADAWVARINHDGSLHFATLFGGSAERNEGFFGPVVDAAGRVYLTGHFISSDIPVTADAFQDTNYSANKHHSTMLVVFSPDGKRLLHSSFYSGSNSEIVRHLAIHPDGSRVYIVGNTRSKDIPQLNPVQSHPGAGFLGGAAIRQ